MSITQEDAKARDKVIDAITVELHAQLVDLWAEIAEAIARNEERKTRISVSIPLAEDDGSFALEVKTKVASRTPKAASEMIHIG